VINTMLLYLPLRSTSLSPVYLLPAATSRRQSALMQVIILAPVPLLGGSTPLRPVTPVDRL